MAYSNPTGRRPFELASKASHHHVVNDANVQALLRSCWIPSDSESVEIDEAMTAQSMRDLEQCGIRAIICVDGGYTETIVRARYPSVKVCFFQFGALTFTVADLRALEEKPFLRPEDLQKLKNLERLKLALPLSTLRRSDCRSFAESVRRTVHEFFVQTKIDDVSLADTLAWFLFERYRGRQSKTEWTVTSHPFVPDGDSVVLILREMDQSFTFPCSVGGERV